MRLLWRSLIPALLCSLLPVTLARAGNSENEKTPLVVKVQDVITTLNAIIERPEEASMATWERLSSPHSETELMFYMNSISDGTQPRYEEGTHTSARLLSHSQRFESREEPSVVLGHLRLSLLAFNRRPGAQRPAFLADSAKVDDLGPAEVRVRLRYRYYDAAGSIREVPAHITLDVVRDIGNPDSLVLYLFELEVDGHKLFGWWR